MSIVQSIRIIGLLLTVIGLGTTRPIQAQDKFLTGETINMLIVGDPFALSLQRSIDELNELSGGTFNIEVVAYNDTYEATFLNSRDQQSAYDIVSFDAVWAGEYGEKSVLLPLNERIAASTTVNISDFLEMAYASGASNSVQYGLPIQPHPELLWYRKDLFETASLIVPTTTDDLLKTAEQLTNQSKNQYGICWNGQRGQALGQQMAHFYAAFGQPLLDENGLPTLNTPKGIAAAEYAKALLPFSPPDVLNMAWDQRPARFSQGECVMTYEWAARTYLVEEDPISLVIGQVGYAAAPYAPDAAPVTPLGIWHLGIPANIGDRADVAWRALEWLTSSETQTLLAENGNGGMPRYSILENPSLQERYPAFQVVAELGTQNQLNVWMRPAVPQWPMLADILGTVYHDMLNGKLTPEAAAAEAQSQAEALFEVSN